MQSLRSLIRNHRPLAVVLLALALCMKTMVPAGFMVGGDAKSFSITICDGHGPDLTREITLPQTGQSHEKSGEPGKAPDACPYSALAMAALSGAQAALLVVALAFILMRGTWPAAMPLLTPRSFLRPPLRGPPLPR